MVRSAQNPKSIKPIELKVIDNIEEVDDVESEDDVEILESEDEVEEKPLKKSAKAPTKKSAVPATPRKFTDEKPKKPLKKLVMKPIEDSEEVEMEPKKLPKPAKEPKRAPSKWNAHVSLIRKANPLLSFKDCVALASESYEK